MKNVSRGVCRKADVLSEAVRRYKAIYISVSTSANMLDAVIGGFLRNTDGAFLNTANDDNRRNNQNNDNAGHGAGAGAPGNNNNQQQPRRFQSKPAFKCSVCRIGNLEVRKKKDNKGFFLGCSNYPTCKTAYWLPDFVVDAAVTDDACRRCNQNVNQIRFTFDRQTAVGTNVRICV